MPGAMMVRDQGSQKDSKKESPPSSKTVLVVDDTEIVCRSVRRMLESLGRTVFLAKDGEEALEVLAKNPQISLVLSDIDMPGMDGLELLRRIRAEYKEVRILLMTGKDLPEIKIEKGPKFLGILQKPFPLEDLKKYLD